MTLTTIPFIYDYVYRYSGAQSVGGMNLHGTQAKRVYSMLSAKQVYPSLAPPGAVACDDDIYKCDPCNKTFRTAQGLKYHNMHHTG